MQKRHRIFIAINLPQEIKKELERYNDKWPELQGKWTTRENLHITLQFLGELTDLEIADVCGAVKEIAEQKQSFSLSLQNIIYAPPGKIPPKMIWVVGEKSKELAQLREGITEALSDKIRFIPEKGGGLHITLSRLAAFTFQQFQPDEIPEVNESLDLSFTVESIEVMESTLKKGGPIYEIIESHQLQL